MRPFARFDVVNRSAIQQTPAAEKRESNGSTVANRMEELPPVINPGRIPITNEA